VLLEATTPHKRRRSPASSVANPGDFPRFIDSAPSAHDENTSFHAVRASTTIHDGRAVRRHGRASAEGHQGVIPGRLVEGKKTTQTRSPEILVRVREQEIRRYRAVPRRLRSRAKGIQATEREERPPEIGGVGQLVARIGDRGIPSTSVRRSPSPNARFLGAPIEAEPPIESGTERCEAFSVRPRRRNHGVGRATIYRLPHDVTESMLLTSRVDFGRPVRRKMVHQAIVRYG